MSQKAAQLQLHRESLIARSASQRHDLALAVFRLHKPLALVDRSVAVFHQLLRYRWVLAVAGLALMRANRGKSNKVPGKVWSLALLAWPRYSWLLKQAAGLVTRKPVPKRQLRWPGRRS